MQQNLSMSAPLASNRTQRPSKTRNFLMISSRQKSTHQTSSEDIPNPIHTLKRNRKLSLWKLCSQTDKTMQNSRKQLWQVHLPLPWAAKPCRHHSRADLRINSLREARLQRWRLEMRRRVSYSRLNWLIRITMLPLTNILQVKCHLRTNWN